MERGRVSLERRVLTSQSLGILGLGTLLQRKAVIAIMIHHPCVLVHNKGQALKKIEISLNTEAPNKLVKIKEPLTNSFPLIRSKNNIKGIKATIKIQIVRVRARNINLLKVVQRSKASIPTTSKLNCSNKTQHKRRKLKREHLMQKLQIGKMTNLSMGR